MFVIVLTSVQTFKLTTMDRFFFALFISIIISIFFAPGLGVLRSAKMSVEASNWPSVMGTITNVFLHENSNGYNDNTYEVKVEYRYSVMGRTYTGSRLAFEYSGSTRGSQEHQDILNKLKSSSSVKVRYSPKNPATSTLSCGIHGSIKCILAFPITSFTFVFCLILSSAITLLAHLFVFTLMFWIVAQPDDLLLKNLEVIQKR